jgi:hypothetical protein
MKHSVLTLTPTLSGTYHAIFTNDHGRKLYIELSVRDNICNFEKCYYIDRSSKKVPKNLTSEECSFENLTDKIALELDKRFFRIEFSNTQPLCEQDLIALYLSCEKKHILLLLKEENTLRTIFKNRYYRSIYFEVTLDGNRALISTCHYCDERSGAKNIPQGLKTIFFDFSLSKLLYIVNNELEGGFTDVAITENHTITLNRPICGRT